MNIYQEHFFNDHIIISDASTDNNISDGSKIISGYSWIYVYQGKAILKFQQFEASRKYNRYIVEISETLGLVSGIVEFIINNNSKTSVHTYCDNEFVVKFLNGQYSFFKKSTVDDMCVFAPEIMKITMELKSRWKNIYIHQKQNNYTGRNRVIYDLHDICHYASNIGRCLKYNFKKYPKKKDQVHSWRCHIKNIMTSIKNNYDIEIS